MASGNRGGPVSKAAFWIGWILSLLPVLLMCFGLVLSLVNRAEMDKGFAKYGYPQHLGTPILVVELACVVLYLIPRTAVLGAVLLTGYLGGATATHVRIGDPMFFMPIVLGVVVWLGLYLRDRRVRALLPLRS